MKKIVDLHVHTNASDGILSPTQLVKEAKNLGISAIAIADHDTVGGLKEGISAGEKNGLEVIPAIEITAYWAKENRREFHILGLFIDFTNEELLKTLDSYRKEREERARKVIIKLNELGYFVTYEQVSKLALGTIGRPHLAQAVLNNPENKELLRKNFGNSPDKKDLIVAYMIPSKSAYVEKAGMEPKETIDLIHRANGLAILAHPCWDLKIGEEEVIAEFVNWGVDGLEVLQARETKEKTLENQNYFTKEAEKFHLLKTGGSDFHSYNGDAGGNLGLLNWNIEIPYSYLEKLKEALNTKVNS